MTLMQVALGLAFAGRMKCVRACPSTFSLLVRRRDSEDFELFVGADKDFAIGDDGHQVGVAADVGPGSGLDFDKLLNLAGSYRFWIVRVEEDWIPGSVCRVRQSPDDGIGVSI